MRSPYHGILTMLTKKKYNLTPKKSKIIDSPKFFAPLPRCSISFALSGYLSTRKVPSDSQCMFPAKTIYEWMVNQPI